METTDFMGRKTCLNIPYWVADLFSNGLKYEYPKTCMGRCEKQELNLRTPTRTDLESASVDHLDILAQNTVGIGM